MLPFQRTYNLLYWRLNSSQYTVRYLYHSMTTDWGNFTTIKEWKPLLATARNPEVSSAGGLETSLQMYRQCLEYLEICLREGENYIRRAEHRTREIHRGNAHSDARRKYPDRGYWDECRFICQATIQYHRIEGLVR